jgi:hypothetical protein
MLPYSSIPNCRVPLIVAYPCILLKYLSISGLFPCNPYYDHLFVLMRSTVCARVTYACERVLYLTHIIYLFTVISLVYAE